VSILPFQVEFLINKRRLVVLSHLLAHLVFNSLLPVVIRPLPFIKA